MDLAEPVPSLSGQGRQLFGVFYIALIVVFGLAFLIPVGVAVIDGDGPRGMWHSILVGLFTGAASVGLVTGGIAMVAFFAPAVFVGGVGWLVVLVVIIASTVAMMRVTPGWMRDSDQYMDGVVPGEHNNIGAAVGMGATERCCRWTMQFQTEPFRAPGKEAISPNCAPIVKRCSSLE